MTGLLLPKRMQGTPQRATSGGEAIGKSSVHRMDSDDFVTRDNVTEQLEQLKAYVAERREEEPDYTLPKPSGWKLMVLMLTIPETSAGGVIVVDDAKEARALASPQGVILDMGPAAYSDPDRFMVDGVLTPWHDIGDRITITKYDAGMFQIANGQRLGFINDTQPIATIDKGWAL